MINSERTFDPLPASDRKTCLKLESITLASQYKLQLADREIYQSLFVRLPSVIHWFLGGAARTVYCVFAPSQLPGNYLLPHWHPRAPPASPLSRRAYRPPLPNASSGLTVSWHPHKYIPNKFWTSSVSLSHVKLIMRPAGKLRIVGEKLLLASPHCLP